MAIVVVLLGVAAIFAGRGHSEGGSHPQGASARPAAAPSPTPTVPLAPSTTVAPSAVKLVSSTPTAASYQVTGASAIKVEDAGGACWVQIRRGGATGSVIFEGVLHPGQSQAPSGPAWLRVGDPPAVTVTVNGTPITPPPAAAGRPYDFVVDSFR